MFLCVSVEDEKKVGGSKLDASVGREEQDSDSGAESALESCDSLEEEGSDVSTSEDDESLCDLYLPRSGGEGQVAGRDGEGWREEDNVPLSEDTSRRLALCNMDWDRMGAEDVFGEYFPLLIPGVLPCMSVAMPPMFCVR